MTKISLPRFVFAFCLLPFALSAQSAFKSSAELVSIDVLATDAQGMPLGDLTAKDFTLKVDGKLRPLQSVQLVRLADPSRPAVAAPTIAPAAPAPFAVNTDP
ncbi:MAG: hypothetical protein WCQ64_10310, partial [Acidobacteriota bacterium]